MFKGINFSRQNLPAKYEVSQDDTSSSVEHERQIVFYDYTVRNDLPLSNLSCAQRMPPLRIARQGAMCAMCAMCVPQQFVHFHYRLWYAARVATVPHSGLL